MQISAGLLGGWDHAARLMLEVGQPENLGYPETTWPTTTNRLSPATWGAVYLGQPDPPPNQPPTADAGEDFVVQVASAMPITLNGDHSYDPDGNRLTYRWTQVGGAAVTLEGARSMNPRFTIERISGRTTLAFRLVVNDGMVDSTADEVTVTLFPTPQPPGAGLSLFLPVVTSPAD
jgi:hypothetical protein